MGAIRAIAAAASRPYAEPAGCPFMVGQRGVNSTQMRVHMRNQYAGQLVLGVLGLALLCPVAAQAASGTVTAWGPLGKAKDSKPFLWENQWEPTAAKATFGWTAGPLVADDNTMAAVSDKDLPKFAAGPTGRPMGIPNITFYDPAYDPLGDEPPPNVSIGRNAYSLSGNHGSTAQVSFSGSSTVESKVSMGMRGPIYKATLIATATGSLGADTTVARKWYSHAEIADPMLISASDLASMGVAATDSTWDYFQVFSFGASVDSPEGLVTMTEHYQDAAGTFQSLSLSLTKDAASVSMAGLLPQLYLLDEADAWMDAMPAEASLDDVLGALKTNRHVTLGVMLAGIAVPRLATAGTEAIVAQVGLDLAVQDGAAAPPVPEPQAWALGLVGFALTGCQYRLRNRATRG
jgi:hypothetical protein